MSHRDFGCQPQTRPRAPAGPKPDSVSGRPGLPDGDGGISGEATTSGPAKTMLSPWLSRMLRVPWLLPPWLSRMLRVPWLRDVTAKGWLRDVRGSPPFPLMRSQSARDPDAVSVSTRPALESCAAPRLRDARRSRRKALLRTASVQRLDPSALRPEQRTGPSRGRGVCSKCRVKMMRAGRLQRGAMWSRR